MAEEEWLDGEAAARYLGLSQKAVMKLIDEGQLDAQRDPVRMRRADLVACLDRCRIEPGELAHLDPNAGKRAQPGQAAPLTRAGTADRRYGRRYGSHPTA